MSRYASSTTVPVERSQAELVGLLKRHGATAHAFGISKGVAQVMFELQDRRVRFELKIPIYAEFGAKMPSTIRCRAPNVREAWCRAHASQVERQRWRALILVVKAKLELIAEGMGSVETEFLANIVLPDGRSVGEWFAPQLAAAYHGNRMPPLLPGRAS